MLHTHNNVKLTNITLNSDLCCLLVVISLCQCVQRFQRVIMHSLQRRSIELWTPIHMKILSENKKPLALWTINRTTGWPVESVWSADGPGLENCCSGGRHLLGCLQKNSWRMEVAVDSFILSKIVDCLSYLKYWFIEFVYAVCCSIDKPKVKWTLGVDVRFSSYTKIRLTRAVNADSSNIWGGIRP